MLVKTTLSGNFADRHKHEFPFFLLGKYFLTIKPDLE